MRIILSVSTVLLLIGLALGTSAQADALQQLKDYIEVDTTNPPGNEARGVAFFSKIFDAAGIDYETVESAPGRGNFWARLEGGDQPALILLHHMDVVPATRGSWDSDPLQAVVKDGKLVGRGTLDTKSLGILHLQAFLALHRSGKTLNRDVIFMATADEEAGGMFGAGWLVENRPELFTGVGYLLNEGGWGVRSDHQAWFEIEIAQKRPYWLRLIATDEPGHGSMPQSSSAPTRLIAALQRIQQSPFEPHVVPAVRKMFKEASVQADPEWRDSLANIDRAVRDPDFLTRFQAARPDLHALVRNTCSITMLTGSQKINVVPPTASAELDCRILPDQDAREFLEAITARIDDDHIRVEEILLFNAAESSTDTDLYRLLERVTRAHYPNASILTAVSTGFTDSHFFRDLGIVSYGYSPTVIPEQDLVSAHGNNERLDIDSFNRGLVIMTEIVNSFAAQ
jgi:acetylornithine deacetylase/succinyl-diaminopimelate desuccinylase-like protein